MADITPFEGRLLEALRAFPDRLEMWLQGGDPLGHHRDLISLYTGFFDICNAHGIEYWLEYGSLLGYVRHRGIIPWEWDMDVGCTQDNFRKILEVGEKIERDDPRFGFRYYDHPACEVPGYTFYLKSDPEVLCDIVEYRQQEDQLVCAVDAWHYPSQLAEDVLPVRRVTLLGQSALVPARPEKVLEKTQSILGQSTRSGDGSAGRNRIGYEQYDPVPFLLTQLYHPESAERLCSPPELDVDEARSITEGFETSGRAGLPFVVRGCRVAEVSRAEFVARMERAEGIVFGYGGEQQVVGDLRLGDAVRDWKRDALAANIVDAQIHELFSPSEVDGALQPYGITARSLMSVLTRRLTHTPFHQDPPLKGGGWMWLAEGQKLWNFVDFKYCDTLLDGGTKTLQDLSPAELLYGDGHALWGRVRQAWIEGGDFLYFPPACAHSVHTYKASIGLGGYAVAVSEAKRMEKVAAWYAERQLDIHGGV